VVGFLTIAAVLFALLALSNFLKSILADSHTGFVFFGRRLSGVPNDILGPVFGFILVAYVIAIWQMRRYALPHGWAYAAYVVASGVLFPCTPPTSHPRRHSWSRPSC
jgi:hypothetical protein